MASAIGRLWRGELPLGDAFWMWAVLGGLVVNGVTTGLSLVLVGQGMPIAGLVVGNVLSLPYNVLVIVGVWRAADRFEGERTVAETSRYATLVGLVVLSVT
jgi:hypothetical protein